MTATNIGQALEAVIRDISDNGRPHSEADYERVYRVAQAFAEPTPETKARITERYGIPSLYTIALLTDFRRGIVADLDSSTSILGPVGIGKTHLAAAMVKHLALKHFLDRPEWRVKWRKAAQILLDIRETYSGNGSERAVMEGYVAPDTLVIDDLGAEKVTDWSLSVLYLIIADRVDYEKQTIVTTNMTLEEVDGMEPRIASRLASFQIIGTKQLGEKDRRLTA